MDGTMYTLSFSVGVGVSGIFVGLRVDVGSFVGDACFVGVEILIDSVSTLEQPTMLLSKIIRLARDISEALIIF